MFSPALKNEFPDVYKKYKMLPPNKALAVVVGPDGSYAYGFGSGCETIQRAKEEALFQCNAQQKVRQIHIECEVRMVNDKEIND